MEQCASILLALPPKDVFFNKGEDGSTEAYDQAVSAHMLNLSKILRERSKDIVAYSSDLLEVVDPAIHSLSYLAVLHALLFPSPASNVPQLFIQEKLVIFMMSFDGLQCRHAGSLLLDVMEGVGSGRLLPPSVAVHVLASAILRLDPTGSILTSSHLLLAKLAYETDNIQPALPVIDKNIMFYPGMANMGKPTNLCDMDLSPADYISKSTGLTALVKSSAVLEHDLVCGMMYCERRDWKKARAAFERAVTFPTKDNGCSKIMVDAFKKWILVSLLSDGKHALLPSYTNAFAVKTFGTLGRPYLALAEAFATDDVNQLTLEAAKNTQLWREDGNVSLVREVMSSYQQWRVLSLQDIYTQISITEIRQQTKSADTGEHLATDEDVEALIQNMIIEGMLTGTIAQNDDGTRFLRFLSPTAQLTEKEVSVEIQRGVLKLNDLRDVFSATKKRLTTSKEYIRWVVKERARDKSGDAQEPTFFDTQIDDEDLMGGKN